MESSLANAFVDELEKIAEDVTSQYPLKDRVLSSAGGLVAGAYAYKPLSQNLQRLYGKGVISGLNKNLNAPGAASFEDLRRVMNIRRPVEFVQRNPEAGAYYVPRKERVGPLLNAQLERQWLKSKPGVGRIYADRASTSIAHELGHAGVRESSLGRALGTARRFSALGSIGATGSALLADPDSAVSKYSPLLAAAAYAPTLIDEGAATFLGDRGLRRLGVDKAVQSGYRKGTLKGFGSYSLAALLATGSPAVVRQVKKVLLNRKEKRRSAAARRRVTKGQKELL